MEDKDMDKILNENDLESVVGGKKINVKKESLFSLKKSEFEAAWDKLGMEKKGYTGNMKAEMFEEWESTGYKIDAVTFLT